MVYYICLRDDDTCYHTNLSELSHAYGHYWGQLPITLAVVPFVHGSHQKMIGFGEISREEQLEKLQRCEHAMTAHEFAQYSTCHPVGENRSLIAMLEPLLEAGLVEAAMHGVRHRFFPDGPEMLRGHVSAYDVRDAKMYLEKVFSRRIETFIPPSNTIDLPTLRLIDKAKLRLFSSGSIRFPSQVHRLGQYLIRPSEAVRAIYARFRGKRSLKVRRSGIARYESQTFGLHTDPKAYLATVCKQLEDTGAVSLASHYWMLNQYDAYRSAYHAVIDELVGKYPQARFVTATELAQALV